MPDEKERLLAHPISERSPIILYVEDDPLSREVMELCLTHLIGLARDEQFFLFETSEGFATRLSALPVIPNVILLDIHMWPVDGFEMLAYLRAQPKYAHIPVVALTASVMNEEIALMRRAGFNGCIAKPLNQDTFARNLTHILGGENIWQI